MKLLILAALLIVICVNFTAARWQRCQGQQWLPTCWGQGLRGRGGRGCRGQSVWYYDNFLRQCRPLYYAGCAGNYNRWCSRAACQRACGRLG